MMAELIVTKKEIVPQLKKSTGISRPSRKSTAWVVNEAFGGEAWGRALDSLVPWLRGVLGGGVRCISTDAG